MAVFRYQGLRSGSGKKIQGVVDAGSERDARQRLKKQGVHVTRMTQENAIAGREGKRSANPRVRDFVPPMRERMVFIRQMAALLASGFPVMEALQGVEQQLPRGGRFRLVMAEIGRVVREGKPLSAGMARFPRIFPPIHISLVRAGEQGGVLEGVLQRLAEVMEAQARIRGRLLSAFIYPGLLVVGGVALLIFLLTVVVPQVVVVFQNSQEPLPGATRALLVVSQWVREFGLVSGFLTGVGVLLLVWWWRTPSGRPRMERMLFGLPALGVFLRHMATQRVSQLLALLLASGVPTPAALRVTGAASGFATIDAALSKVALAVEHGDPLADAMRRTGCFPDLALRMVHSGEQAGNLPELLDRVSRLFQEENERIIARMLRLVEPLLIMTLGGVVTFVILAVLLPIFEMTRWVG